MSMTPCQSDRVRCHVCGAADLDVAAGYGRFRRVTSDCKPWPAGGSLARCRTCGSVQALMTLQWQQEADTIYAGYSIYHQGGGAEQRVFGDSHGIGEARSDRLVSRLRDSCRLPAQGRLLDVGCGNGSFLSAWSRRFPGWSLSGTEVSEKHRPDLERIAGFAGLYTGDLTGVAGTFDVISLIHVLEHIPGPIGFLERCRQKLNPDGWLLIEVPDCRQNPFMLLVADHCSHFSTSLLGDLVAAAGFDLHEATNQWVVKEISVTARPRRGLAMQNAPRLSQSDSEAVFSGWRQLEGILAKVAPLAERRPFGLFGTAIAATWLDAELEGAAQFFVDEDPTRIGNRHLDRPILAPADVPEHATVFVALPSPTAEEVMERLTRLDKGLQVVEA